jgi:hypothetical protein
MTLLLFLLAVAAPLTFAMENSSLNEAQVFEWWDDGIIDGDEAHEILDLLEEGNTQEACILAEVYALESCASEEKEYPKATNPHNKLKTKKRTATKKSGKQQEQTSLVPHGYIEWQGRTDSLGYLENQRTDIRIDFYRYTLRLGAQSLLTYKNAGSEAHFGQISTKELHSVIPLDTLWGTALFYPLYSPIGIFRLGGLLDTAKTIRTSFAFSPFQGSPKDFEIGLAYWHHLHPADSVERRSFAAQAKGSWGNFAIWWVPENAGDLPLIKLQLQHREKMEYATLAWKTDVYAHGDSLPEEARLSATIAKSRLWGSQTIGAIFSDAWKSRFTANARTMIPLEGDTSKTRFKASAESGPGVLRGTASVTCLSAEDHCRQNDLALKIRSSWNVDREQLVFSGKVRARHTRDEGFGTPLYEAGIAYAQDAANNTSIAITVPKGTPSKEIQLRSSTEIGTDFLQLSLAVTFRRTAEEALHPLHAAMKARVCF